MRLWLGLGIGLGLALTLKLNADADADADANANANANAYSNPNTNQVVVQVGAQRAEWAVRAVDAVGHIAVGPDLTPAPLARRMVRLVGGALAHVNAPLGEAPVVFGQRQRVYRDARLRAVAPRVGAGLAIRFPVIDPELIL